jgi:hypothetical protein
MPIRAFSMTDPGAHLALIGAFTLDRDPHAPELTVRAEQRGQWIAAALVEALGHQFDEIPPADLWASAPDSDWANAPRQNPSWAATSSCLPPLSRSGPQPGPAGVGSRTSRWVADRPATL